MKCNKDYLINYKYITNYHLKICVFYMNFIRSVLKYL